MGFRVLTSLVASDHPDAINALANELDDGESPKLVLAFASPARPLADVMSASRARFPSATCLGATTAGELTEKGDAKGAIAGIAIHGDFHIHAGISDGLAKNPEAAVTRALSTIPTDVPGYPHRTGLLLLDPLTGRGEEATLLAATLLGAGVPIVGGAAGDDLAMTKAEVALGEHAQSDALVLAVLHTREPLAVGVCHGHVPLSSGHRVTKASGSIVYELDGRPAWDVWVEETRVAAARDGIDATELGPEAIGAFLLRYEAGLATGAEHKIRAPLSRGADGSLSFACGIPEGAELVITASTPDQQIESARQAAIRAREALGNRRAAGAIVFDCICRNLILGKDFERAVGAISNELGGVPLAGFQTYGEIALGQGDLSGFHNTTTVILAFPA